MFYTTNINGLGCLLGSLLFAWLFFALKLYYIVFVIIILAVIYIVYLKIKANVKKYTIQKEKDYEPEIGEVYKVCPYCGSNVKRNSTSCPNCNSKFE